MVGNGSEEGLAEYPLLAAWYAEASSKEATADLNTRLQLGFCHSLTSADDSFLAWAGALELLLKEAAEPQDVWLQLDHFFFNHGLAFQQLAADMVALAIQSEHHSFLALLERAAYQTELVSFYFLAAWSAFNLAASEACLRLCDAVVTPYAPLYALKGQALLERGDVAGAIAALETASEIDPNDPMIWFQLAKAEIHAGENAAAWQTLQVCGQLLRPGHPELALLKGFIALEQPYQTSWQAEAHAELTQALEGARGEASQATLGVQAMKLALAAGDKQWAATTAAQVPWQNLVPTLMAQRELGPLLRTLGEKGWHDVAGKILAAFGSP